MIRRGVDSEKLRRWSGIVLEKMILLENWQKLLLWAAIPVSAVLVFFCSGCGFVRKEPFFFEVLFAAYLWACVNLAVHLTLTYLQNWDIQRRRRIAAVCAVTSWFITVAGFLLYKWFATDGKIFENSVEKE